MRPSVNDLLSAFNLPVCGESKRLVTPADAKVILQYNWGNKPLRKHHIKRLVENIKAGFWVYNGDPVRFATTGRLLDGQHRCYAIIESGIALEMLLLTGLQESVFSSIDTDGLARTRGDIVSQLGGKYCSTAACAVPLIYSHLTNRGWSKNSIPIRLFQDLYIQYREQGLETSAQHAVRWTRSGLLPPSIYTSLHYLFSLNGFGDAATNYFDLLTTGADLKSDSILFLLRETIIKNMANSTKKLSPQVLSAIIIKVWNNYNLGRPMKLMRWSPGAEEYPTIFNLGGQ
jgi:hypothetical protein